MSLLVPYFLWKHLPPPPAAAALTVRLRQDQRHCCVSYALVEFVPVVAAVTITSSARNHPVSAAAVCSKPAEDFFLNVQQSDNYDRLTLEELSFLLPIFWTKMFL